MRAAHPLMMPAPLGESGRRLIPFEQSFEFDLLGKKRTLKQSVVVSVEAPFTATSIGYGFVPIIESVAFGPQIGEFKLGPPTATLGEIPMRAILAAADAAFSQRPEFGRSRPAADAVARIGIQVNPDLAHVALQGSTLAQASVSRLFRVVGNDGDDLLFRYGLFDEGTGRAFQSDPVLNIAGLGTAKGERPFRHFNPPIEFAPKSAIGLEVIEVSNHVGSLFFSLQGFKILGDAGTPTGSAGRARRMRRSRR
jgi:hypothetical protein